MNSRRVGQLLTRGVLPALAIVLVALAQGLLRVAALGIAVLAAAACAADRVLIRAGCAVPQPRWTTVSVPAPASEVAP